MNPSSVLDFSASPWVFDLLTHLWQSTVVALAVMLLVTLCGRLPARTRRALGWIAVVKFALPASWLAQLVEHAGGEPKPWLASDALMLPVNLVTKETVALAAPGGIPVTSLLAAIWMIGSAGLIAGWIVRAIRARREILTGAIAASDALAQRAAAAAGRAGLRTSPRCVTVAPGHGPALVGVAAPVLVLPRGLEEALTPGELDSILIHECVHLQRRDNFWNAVRAGFVGLLWFNPIAWLLNRAIGIETEKSCDERVLEITGDADAYASGIVASVRHTLGEMRPCFSGATTPPVVGRIKAILAFPARRERPLARRVVLLAGVGLVALSGRGGSIAAERSTAAPTPSLPTSVTPTAGAQLGATLPARYRVGTITFTFVGAANVVEQVLRDAMQIRPGGEFDETMLDRDIRALYRTGFFKFVEVRHEMAGGNMFNLIVTLTPAPGAATSAPTQTAPDNPASDAAVPANLRSVDEELADAKQKLAEANAELKKLRDERAASLARQAPANEAPAAASTPRSAPRVIRPVAVPGESSLRPTIKAVTTPVAMGAPAPQTLGVTPVYEIAALDQTPIARFQARPQYPFEMRKAGIGGEAVVDFIVNEKGEVVNAFAIRSSRSEFEAAAVHAVSKWRFRPGRKDGRDVNTHMQVPIVFTLSEH